MGGIAGWVRHAKLLTMARRNGTKQKPKPTPRRTLRYQQARAAFIARAKPECGVCHGFVDKRLDGRHPMGPQVDHKVPFEAGTVSFWNTDNWQLVHARCNQRKGIGVELEARPFLHTREWYPGCPYRKGGQSYFPPGHPEYRPPAG